jgi:hypothetical protein
MSDQKNIDRLFQDKLQGFEQQPRPEVWSQIQDRMQRKKKRRIPIWWWYTGAAAVLILSLFLLLPKDVSDQEIITDPIITESPTTQDVLDSLPKQQPQQPFVTPKVLKEDNTLLTEKTNTDSDAIESVNQKKRPQKSIVPNTRIAENIIVNKKSDQLEENRKNTSNVDAVKDSEKENLNTINDILKRDKNQEKLDKDKDSKPIFEVNQPKDSLKKKLTTPKKESLYTQLDEELLEETKKRKKWAVRPLVALSTVASSSNSPTDQIFSNNPTNGNRSFDYGLSVSYRVNKKLTIQTGVLTQNVNFDTEQVSLVQTPNPPRNQLSNISLNVSLPFALAGATDAVALSQNFVASPSVPDADAQLNQAISYVEIPLEVKYQVTSSKRLNTAIIGGFSSLFLNDNEIILDSEIVGRRSIGSANNLNNINFSGNFGLELDYKIYKQLFFNVNPMVKVHLNTFSRDNNNYLPVFIGVYSGVKYQF